MSYPGFDSPASPPERPTSESPNPYSYPASTPPPPPPPPPISAPPVPPPGPYGAPPPPGPYGAPPPPGPYGAPPPPPAGPYGAPMPIPSPPTYDPIATQQFSAPPSAIPYGYAPPPPPRRSRVGLVLLSISTALAVAVAGVLGTLFVLKLQDANRLSSDVTSLTSDNNTQRDKIAALQKDLDAAKRDLKDSGDQVTEITSQKKALADCLNAFYDATDALDAANGQRTAEVNAKIAEYDRLCNIADRYL